MQYIYAQFMTEEIIISEQAVKLIAEKKQWITPIVEILRRNIQSGNPYTTIFSESAVHYPRP